MRPEEGESECLRLAAKAAGRGNAAQREWPAFEKRLKELGYCPLAIAHAFSTLSGPGTVAEALEVLRTPVPESHPITLGSHFGLTRSIDTTGRANTRARGRGRGRLTLALPPPPATMLRIRITWDVPHVVRMPWDAPLSSIWERPAHEVRVSLPDR
jgi:hypothetical protein